MSPSGLNERLGCKYICSVSKSSSKVKHMLLMDLFKCLFTSSQLYHDAVFTRTHFSFHTQTLSHVSITRLLLRSKVCTFPAGFFFLGRNPALIPHFLLSADSPHLCLSRSLSLSQVTQRNRQHSMIATRL